MGQGDAVEDDNRGGVRGKLGGGQLADFLRLGLLDAHQRGVAELVAAGLDGEHGWGGHFDLLEPALFEFSFDLDFSLAFEDFHMQDERGVGQADEFGEDDPGLTEAQVFRLQSGQDQVGALLLDRGGKQAGHAEGIAGPQIVAGDVDGAIGPFSQGFADGLADALRSGGEDDDFAAELLFELKGFFKGVGVGLVEGELEIGLVDPLAGRVDAYLRVAFGDLFNGYNDFQSNNSPHSATTFVF